MLATLLFSALLAYSVQGQCQRTGYSLIGDLCYEISNQQLNFQDARSYCQYKSSNLAVIHTSLQATFLASNVRTQTGAPGGNFWIGLRRAGVGSRFMWDDGTYMYWSNFDSNFPQDDLIVAESTVNGKWRTLSGDQKLYFVCSYDPATVSPQSSTTWAESTTTGPYDSSTSTTAYPTVTTEETWTSYGTTEGTTDYHFSPSWI